MRVLLTGASGFIGRAIAEALLARGHEVVCVSRHPGPAPARCSHLAADFAEVPSRSWWAPRLSGIDAVINAVGIIRERGRQSFAALHRDAPIELFEACASAGVPLVLQISALGADETARTAYHRTKKAADDHLRALPLRSVVIQPSLVWGPGGASTGLFHGLAALPLLPLPAGGRMPVQPVHRDDLVEGVVALLDAAPRRPMTVAFTGREPVSLRDYLAQLRAALGFSRPAWTLPVPGWLFRLGARIAGLVPASPLDAATAQMLLAGNAAPADAFARLLARPPRPVAGFIPPGQAGPLRIAAILGVGVPALRIALALMWLWTGIVSLGLYPVQDSYALLARVGLHGALATLALYGAAALDLVLGLAILLAPARLRRLAWGAQILLVAGYTVLITLFLPEQWLHPYGPVSKNIPLLAATALLWALEPPRRRTAAGKEG